MSKVHKIQRGLCRLIILLGAILLSSTPTFAEDAKEITGLLDRLLGSPQLQAQPGFSVNMLVPPGEFYDPLWLLQQGDVVWINDDGGEEGEKGSQILAVTADGKVSDLIALGRLLPTTGFDIAPADFGAYGGHIFTVGQGKVSLPGAMANHVIQRVDPKTQDVATVVCTLPAVNDVPSGFGVDARFGPAGSPFAGKFYAAAALNNTIYQITPDGTCTPFITFDAKPWGSPTGFTFSADGKSMFVAVTQGSLLEPATPGGGAIVRVSPEGKMDAEPVVTGLSRPMGVTQAPGSFGAYGGQLFISDGVDLQAPVPMTQALKTDGKIYRAAIGGAPQLVATGFVNPSGLQVVGDALWVTDINGDFIGGQRELPDGFVAMIQVVGE
jgi:DNA-binding beta-propeller fold protein YncE